MPAADFLDAKPLKDFCRRNPHFLLLAFVAILYITVFTIIETDMYHRFRFGDFDLAIAAQGLWLLSHGKTPFVTVRGADIFGDHIQFNYLLLAPFYRLLPDVRLLFFLQSLFLASGAVPLYFIAKEKLKDRWLPFAFVLSFLLYPALHFLNLENFHAVSLGVPLFFSAFYFLQKRRWKIYYPLLSLILISREEYFATALALGAYSFAKVDRKAGVVTAALSILWIIVASQLILPFFGGGHYVQAGRATFGEFGDSEKPLSLAINVLTRPSRVIKAMMTPPNAKYLFDLFLPVAFLPMLAPETLLLIPPLLINLLIDWPYARSIEFHYTTAIIPFVFISSVYAIASLRDIVEKRSRGDGRKIIVYLLALFMLFGLYGNISRQQGVGMAHDYTHLNVNGFGLLRDAVDGFWDYKREEKIRYDALAALPPHASVSASYLFLPHVANRETVYMFPNPFRESYWGLELGNYTPPPPTRDTDYMIHDQTPNDEEKEKVIGRLRRSGAYYAVYDMHGIAVLQRNRSVELPRI